MFTLSLPFAGHRAGSGVTDEQDAALAPWELMFQGGTPLSLTAVSSNRCMAHFSSQLEF